MKKIVVSSFVIIAFVLYAIFNARSQNMQSTVSEGTGKTNNSQSAQVLASQTPAIIGAYKDGTYIGKSADAFYGTIQVQVIIGGGKITDVQFLRYPNDQHESIEINTQAMPVLKQEAIQSQSAAVDIVSRATDSSQAFNQSLASALSQAH